MILRQMTNQQTNPTTLDRMFHALADPSRRAVVERLVQGPATVGELAKPLDMAMPTVLQHLRVLESSGLIRTEKAGRVRTCRLEPQALASAQGWIDRLRAEWEARLDRLDAYLQTLQESDHGPQ